MQFQRELPPPFARIYDDLCFVPRHEATAQSRWLSTTSAAASLGKGRLERGLAKGKSGRSPPSQFQFSVTNAQGPRR